MPQLTQGLIVALLIGLLLAVIVGYYLRQAQVNELTEALQDSLRRQDGLEDQHEQRLREATEQLQKDYEAHLIEKMDQYQAQLEDQRSQLEAEYRSRQGLVGSTPPAADSSTEPRIRKQYETRLKEVAAKMQQAYEEHLQAKLLEARSQTQQEYDHRLAEAIAHYQDQAQLAQSTRDIDLGALVPESTAADETVDLAAIEARLQAEYDQRLAKRIAEYQDDMAQRLAQLEQDYEARVELAAAASSAPAVAEPSAAELELNLRRELEADLRAEYEQKLAEKIEHYQDELTQRTQELAQSYEARLDLIQTSPASEASPEVEPGDLDMDLDVDLDQAIAAANDMARAAGAATDLDPGLEMAQPLEPNPVAEPLEPNPIAEPLEPESIAEPLEPDPIAEPLEPSPTDPDDLGFANLLNDDLASDPDDFGLGSFFDTDTIDLEALLSAAPPDPASDDLLDSLDDITDLS